MMKTGTYDFTRHVQTLRAAVYKAFGWSYQASVPAPTTMLPMQAWGMIASPSGMFECRGDLTGLAYGGQAFELVDVISRPPLRPKFDTAGQPITGFRGVIVSLAYPNAFSGRTIIRDDYGPLNPAKIEDMKRARMVDLNFERRFEVYTDDQVQARALISPDFMERLMEFSDHYLGRGVQCVFLGRHLHLALNIEDRFRFAHNFSAFDFREAADTLIAEVGSVCLLLEQVQTLQASIGRGGAMGADKARQIYYRDCLSQLITTLDEMEASWNPADKLPEGMRDTHYYFCDSLKGLLYPRF